MVEQLASRPYPSCPYQDLRDKAANGISFQLSFPGSGLIGEGLRKIFTISMNTETTNRLANSTSRVRMPIRMPWPTPAFRKFALEKPSKRKSMFINAWKENNKRRLINSKGSWLALSGSWALVQKKMRMVTSPTGIKIKAFFHNPMRNQLIMHKTSDVGQPRNTPSQKIFLGVHNLISGAAAAAGEGGPPCLVHS